uniref:Si:ch73-193i2.2 n=1 Tax=Oryzias melastigma TaxID=30732 RepID=A0A3B3CR86_ORYME
SSLETLKTTLSLCVCLCAQVDLQFLDGLISDGADPNSSDRYGQTVLHEICRLWSVDVMRFFLDRGADLLCSDQYGVTALHVASALDYQDMVQFLITVQTHWLTCLSPPADNDAVGAIRLLLQAGASSSCTDYKNRTPLHLAANMERSEAARVLLELGAEAGVKDSDGQLCITALIGQMSPVAHLALQQFHVTDKVSRQQYFYLNLDQQTDTPKWSNHERVSPQLEEVVQEGKLDLIMNPVFIKLIQIKWKLYGRLVEFVYFPMVSVLENDWLWCDLSLPPTHLYVSSCFSPDSTVLLCLGDPHVSLFLSQDWWRVLLVALALLLTAEEVFREVQDILRSRRRLQLRQRWMERRLGDDLDCSHPMWPQVRVTALDFFCRNVFDWLVYCLLAASFCVHMTDVFHPSDHLHALSLRLFAVSIIFLWLRLMKHVRAFRLMGPFIVMLGNIIGDVMCFLFLYAEIFIPYACSFWIIFGVPSMKTVSGLLFSLYRITLVDEYEYAAMVTVDDVMAPLLCGTFLAASSILCVNLLIALLTDTFQRVHDNSQANAVMQQAAVVLQVGAMTFLRRFYDEQYISKYCSPLAAGLTSVSGYHYEAKDIKTQIKVSKPETSQPEPKNSGPGPDPTRADGSERGEPEASQARTSSHPRRAEGTADVGAEPGSEEDGL